MSKQIRIIETWNGPKVKRRYAEAYKTQVVAETKEPGKTTNGVARIHGLHQSVVSAWIKADKKLKEVV